MDSVKTSSNNVKLANIDMAEIVKSALVSKLSVNPVVVNWVVYIIIEPIPCGMAFDVLNLMSSFPNIFHA